jgi:hypothetical protein
MGLFESQSGVTDIGATLSASQVTAEEKSTAQSAALSQEQLLCRVSLDIYDSVMYHLTNGN